MLFEEENYKFMYSALREAEYALEKDEIPIGAVVVHKGKIIGRGHNQVEMLRDPTAHAEMLAITSASNHLKQKFLTECDIYVTVEPCMMCAGAILFARIPRLYFGTYEPKFGSSGSVYNLLDKNKYNHTISVHSGIYEKECQLLLQNFFQKKRNKPRKGT